ncbi:MAG: hypothetical protein A2Y66_06700 [Nitrospirae bacterium RBG_13_41_22]|nr:MAG: hypothetical protein A2Y66_06700 [Nitrospirae bacterium RBG_13_41_22]
MEQVFIFSGIWSDKTIPWGEVIGLFLFIAGFIIGLGAVTVIDIHGFLGRKSSYWTEATIRTHKVTKPLIWLGMSLAILGGLIFYRKVGFSEVSLIHTILAALLIINGLFLSFWVSPRLLQREKEGRAHEILSADLQKKIAVSFVISVIGWWSSLFLLVWYIIVIRK